MEYISFSVSKISVIYLEGSIDFINNQNTIRKLFEATFTHQRSK